MDWITDTIAIGNYLDAQDSELIARPLDQVKAKREAKVADALVGLLYKLSAN